MRKRKLGNSLERFKKVCEKNGIILDGHPTNELTIIDENGIEHIVGKDFNLFDNFNLLDNFNFTSFYKNVSLSKSVVLKKEADFKFQKEEINYNKSEKVKININYSSSTDNKIHKFGNCVA